MKKSQVLSVVAVMSAMSLTGCGKKPNSDVVIDDTKAQLLIYTFEGGVGDQWLKNAAKRFEEKNKDRTDFEDGKVGVQFQFKTDRGCDGNLLDSAELTHDIYFTENVNYYGLTNQKKLADITDVLTTPNSEDGGKKIIDKINDNLVDFMNRDKKYYAVPFYDCFYGLVYDKDLFSEKSFYMKDDGTFTNTESEFGTGPNGVKGDWDDGLPKTYDQFSKMMERMKLKETIPFTYSSGNATYYASRALTSYWSDDEGYEDANLNYTFEGTAHHIVNSINNGVAETEEVVITKENGYRLRSQAGLYNALYFAKNILCKESANYRAYSSNYDVQSAFVNNKRIGGSNKPIAMMFEGTWWENEAAPAFDEGRSYGDDSFNYGFMPIPKTDDSKIGDATFVNSNESFGFINANCKNMKLAKEFFSFLHTDAELRAFTLQTNMTRGLDYSFGDSDLSSLSSYARDLIAIKESEHVNIIYPYSGLDFFVNNGQMFSTDSWFWGTTENPKDNPIIKFINNKSLSAEEYFNLHTSVYKKADWEIFIK